jgi:hypothetical protein
MQVIIMNNTLNFNNIDIDIMKLKYPITFIYRLITYKDELNDETISIILRLFFKHHFGTLILDNIILLLEDEFDDYIITYNVIHEFYNLINNKVLLINILKKWYNEYKNPQFWDMNINKQIDYLQHKKEHFQAIFDCSKSNPIPFYMKISHLLNNDFYRIEILDEIALRLVILLQIFPHNIFTELNIPLILASDFYNMPTLEIINYLNIIYNKFNLLIHNTIDLFINFKVICYEIDIILNPLLVSIIPDEINSDTEIDDIHLFCD